MVWKDIKKRPDHFFYIGLKSPLKTLCFFFTITILFSRSYFFNWKKKLEENFLLSIGLAGCEKSTCNNICYFCFTSELPRNGKKTWLILTKGF